MNVEIRRRRHQYPTRSAECAQLHRTVRQRAQPHGDVDAVPDQIDALVGQAEIDGDARVAILEGEDQLTDVSHPQGCCTRHSHRSRRRVALRPHVVPGLLDETEDLKTVAVEAMTLVGQCQAPRGAGQQRHADRILQFVEVPSDARLADAMLPSDRRQTAALDHADEGPHPFEGDVRSIHKTAECYALATRSGSSGLRLIEADHPSSGSLR